MNPNQQRQSEAISDIQKYLRALHFTTDKEIPLVNVDGIYGDETRAAIKQFQEIYKLPVTGITDYRTWEALYKAYKNAETHINRPNPMYAFPEEPGYKIRPGDNSDIVAIIQFILRLLSTAYDGIEGLPPSGVYDSATMNDVKHFQKMHNIPITGIVDRNTWNSLADAYDRNNRIY